MRTLYYFLFLLITLLSFSAANAKEQLIIEPDAGRAPILSAIKNAHQSVDLVIYGLTDNDSIDALIQAKKAGKNVQILLEPHPYKAAGENENAFRSFHAANIPLQTVNQDMKLTHQKTLLIDHQQAIIMTFNLTHSSFKNERNFALVIDDPAMLQEIYRVYTADAQNKNITVNNPNLIWSPNNSREKIAAFIQSAHSELKIYAQDISDYQTIGLLAKAARAGKSVEILTSSHSDRTNKKFEYLRRAGVTIHFSKNYFIHAKVIIADQKRAIIGSINLTRPSINDNRELAIITQDPQVIKSLLATFKSDWQEMATTAKTDKQTTQHLARLFLRELMHLIRN